MIKKIIPLLPIAVIIFELLYFFGGFNILRLPFYRNEYHLKISRYTNDSYCIEYTNTNWVTFHTLNKTFDISDYSKEEDVNLIPKLFYNCESVYDFAQGFENYKKCKLYNDSVYVVYKNLLKYRKSHPVHKETDKENCGNNQIY